jgi:hypothetical protein
LALLQNNPQKNGRENNWRKTVPPPVVLYCTWSGPAWYSTPHRIYLSLWVGAFTAQGDPTITALSRVGPARVDRAKKTGGWVSAGEKDRGCFPALASLEIPRVAYTRRNGHGQEMPRPLHSLSLSDRRAGTRRGAVSGSTEHGDGHARPAAGSAGIARRGDALALSSPPSTLLLLTPPAAVPVVSPPLRPKEAAFPACY